MAHFVIQAPIWANVDHLLRKARWPSTNKNGCLFKDGGHSQL